jgi:hypothetical protein
MHVSKPRRSPLLREQVFRSIRRTAVYGPVRTVVWEGRPRGRPLSRFLMDRVEMEEGLHGSPSPRILAVSSTDIMSPMPSVKAHSSWR